MFVTFQCHLRDDLLQLRFDQVPVCCVMLRYSMASAAHACGAHVDVRSQQFDETRMHGVLNVHEVGEFLTNSHPSMIRPVLINGLKPANPGQKSARC